MNKNYQTIVEGELSNEDIDAAENLEDVLEKIGFGRFHVYLFLISVCAFASDGMEIMSLSFIITPMQCDLHTSPLQRGILSGAMFLGMMFGSFFWGPLSDSRGRRSIMVITTAIHGVAAFVFSLGQNFWFCSSMRFIAGFAMGGTIPLLYAYYTEFQPRSIRGLAVNALGVFYPISGILTDGLAALLIPRADIGFYSPHFVYNNWRILAAACAAPSLIAAVFLPCFPESPKYLLEVDEHENTLAVLNRIAYQNGCIKKDEQICTNVYLAKAEKLTSPTTGIKNTLLQMLDISKSLVSKKYLTVTLYFLFVKFAVFYALDFLLIWIPELMKRTELTGISPCTPFASSNSSSEISNMEQLCNVTTMADTRPYWDTAIIYSGSFPLFILATCLIDRVGRKSILISSLLLACPCMLLIAFGQNRWQVLATLAAAYGLGGNSQNALAVIGAEIIPTQQRSTLLAWGNVSSRIASVVANMIIALLIDVHCMVPFVLAAIMYVAAAICTLFFPDLTNKDIN